MTHREPRTSTPSSARPPGARGFYVASFLALTVSLNTSWRFFGEVLRVTSIVERGVLFTVLEAGLVACGLGMRAGVRGGGGPGPSRVIAWALTAFSAYVAVVLTGPVEGAARVVLGPLLSLVMLHLALGLELRHARSGGGGRVGTWGRIRRELRERGLSRLGLAHEGRTAVALTRDRARTRAVRLATARWAVGRRARLQRALRVGRVANDPVAVAALLGQLAVARHAVTLGSLELGSPWVTTEGQGQGHPGGSGSVTRDQNVVKGSLERVTRVTGDPRAGHEGHVPGSGSPARVTGVTGVTAPDQALDPGVTPVTLEEGHGVTAGDPQGQGQGQGQGQVVGVTRGSLTLLRGSGSGSGSGSVEGQGHDPRVRDQVTQLVALLDELGWDAVTLETVETRLGVRGSTAKRRLRLARRTWRERVEGESDGRDDEVVDVSENASEEGETP